MDILDSKNVAVKLNADKDFIVGLGSWSQHNKNENTYSSFIQALKCYPKFNIMLCDCREWDKVKDMC